MNNIRGKVHIRINARMNSSISYPIEVSLVNDITFHLPDVPIDCSKLTHLNDLPLAYPTFHYPDEIDGVSIFTEVLGYQKVIEETGAIETSLGYIITGCSYPSQTNRSHSSFCALITLEGLVTNMLELENISQIQTSHEDDICFKKNSETTTLSPNGRYTVALPFKSDPTHIGESYNLAKNRSLSLEKKLDRNHTLRETYHSTIKHYIVQGHLSLFF